MVKLNLFGFSEGLYIWCVTQWLYFMIGIIHILKQEQCSIWEVFICSLFSLYVLRCCLVPNILEVMEQFPF